MEKIYRILGLAVVVVIIFMAGHTVCSLSLIDKAQDFRSDATMALDSIKENTDD